MPKLVERHLAVVEGLGRVSRPHVVLSGGEAGVAVRGAGRGGRNAEFCLALALALDQRPGVHLLAADTDGVDGCGPEAGALAGLVTLARARSLSLDAQSALASNDSLGFFSALGDTVTTGLMGTNLNDFRAALVLPDPG